MATTWTHSSGEIATTWSQSSGEISASYNIHSLMRLGIIDYDEITDKWEDVTLNTYEGHESSSGNWEDLG